jgi:RHS repeat-associated protein
VDTGNLRTQVDRLAQVTEDFQYDSLDRLTQWAVYQGCNRATFGYEYNSLGNLMRRTSRLGTSPQAPYEEVVYAYGQEEIGPHAVTRAGSKSLAYDGNGNLTHRQDTTGRNQLIRYTPFNLPRSVTAGTLQVTFGYDADQQRAFKQGNNGRSTVYVGGLYEKRQEPDGTVLHVFSIVGAEGPVAQVQWSDVPVPGGEAVVYLHSEHLGSVESVTNHRGGIEERRKYDPFGQRKNPANPALPFTESTSRVRQGFTGHEHDDELGLINMRGRMYDPKLGRFLTPDPLVQVPFSGQALNRYSYVLNNPLAYVDPSGFQAVTVGDGWRPPETPDSVAGWEEYALLRAPSSASLDTLPSEVPVRVGGPAGSADQNGSRGPDNLALGAGILYGTVQALLPMGFAAPSPAPHLRDFEAGRGGAMAVTGAAMFFHGLALTTGGAGLDILGLAGAPFTAGGSALAIAPGTAAVAAGAAIATHGVANMWAGFNILLMSRESGDGGGRGNGSRNIKGFTQHGQQRRAEARAGDKHRQVGDIERVIREGRQFRDTETGAKVYVLGDRVVILNASDEFMTNFVNPRANTQSRIMNGKWRPVDE